MWTNTLIEHTLMLGTLQDHLTIITNECPKQTVQCVQWDQIQSHPKKTGVGQIVNVVQFPLIITLQLSYYSGCLLY